MQFDARFGDMTPHVRHFGQTCAYWDQVDKRRLQAIADRLSEAELQPLRREASCTVDAGFGHQEQSIGGGQGGISEGPRHQAK
jgi:hypothetical protein